MNIIQTINMESPELKLYSGLSEPSLYHYFEPEPGIFIAESPMIIERALNAGYEPLSFLVDEKHLEQDAMPVLKRCEAFESPIYSMPLDQLKLITGFHLTRGILSAMRRKKMPDPKKLVANARRLAVLENIMNPTNMGAIFRSAAALGIDAILVTEKSTDPLYRRSSRVSVGTVFQVPWTYIPDCSCIFDLLTEYGFQTAAMALCENSISLKELNPAKNEKIALFMGTEGTGLEEETIDACDLTVKIPMAQGIDSLNVAAASAVAFWQIMK